MNTEKEIEKACKNVLRKLKIDSEPKKTLTALESINEFEKLLEAEETRRFYLISKVLENQRLYPEQAIRILELDVLDAMSDEHLNIIINSYVIN